MKKKRPVLPVFPDYLYVSYDYDLTTSGTIDNFICTIQMTNTSTFLINNNEIMIPHQSPFFGEQIKSVFYITLSSYWLCKSDHF